LVESIQECLESSITRDSLGLPLNKRVVAMLPGSRTHEIERHMPILAETAFRLSKQYTDLHFVIPIAGTVSADQVKSYFSHGIVEYTLVPGKAVETVFCSDCVVVASGTASLECALLQKPMCIIYKASLLTYLAASQLIKVNYLGLCNLLENEMVVPELLQYDCNPEELTKVVIDLLTNNQYTEKMSTKLQHIQVSLSSQQADCRISDLILQETLLSNPLKNSTI
jgi:lipid-A-disaccharide synthase